MRCYVVCILLVLLAVTGASPSRRRGQQPLSPSPVLLESLSKGVAENITSFLRTTSGNLSPALGYFDGHNHLSGIIHWEGIILALEKETVYDQWEHKTGFEDYVQILLARPDVVPCMKLPQPIEDQKFLYLHQYLRFRRIAGIRGTFMNQEWRHRMGNFSYCLAAIAQNRLTNLDADKAFGSKWSGRNLYGSRTTRPLISCLSGNFGACVLDGKNCTKHAHKSSTIYRWDNYTDQDYFEKMWVNVDKILSASNMLDFDTSYVNRNALTKGMSQTKLRRMMIMIMEELINNRIKYVELFSTLSTAPYLALREPENKNEEYYQSLYFKEAMEMYADRIFVSWFPMLLAGGFALDKDGVMHRQREGVESVDKAFVDPPPNITVQFNKYITDIIDVEERRNYVGGVDWAGQEYGWYLKENCDQIANFLETLYQKGTTYNKRFVFHMHVGEGYVDWDYSHYLVQPGTGNCRNDPKRGGTALDTSCYTIKTDAQKSQKFCNNAQVQSKRAPVLPKMRTQFPAHRYTAIHNFECVLNAIETYLTSKSEEDRIKFDNVVRVRLGHGTWVTWPLAKRVAKLGIGVDINLSSNIATSAFLRAGMVNSVETMLDNFSTAEECTRVFKQLGYHGFTYLWLAGAKVLLGSDGSGVEHSYFEEDDALVNCFVGKIYEWFSAHCYLEENSKKILCNNKDKSGPPPLLGFEFIKELPVGHRGNEADPQRLYKDQVDHVKWAFGKPA